MIPPLFTLLKNTPAVTALLGASTLRVYPWGEAPENVQKPYATYSVYSGVPGNYVNQTPDIDSIGTQVDLWAETLDSCNNCFVAIRDALEPHAHMTSFQGGGRDQETKLFHSRMDFDFLKERS